LEKQCNAIQVSWTGKSHSSHVKRRLVSTSSLLFFQRTPLHFSVLPMHLVLPSFSSFSHEHFALLFWLFSSE